ncbi:MAG: hypothetical protein GY796_05730 [Chloroflexi bacterium]|nr:hypothetical protein [Chloroflexota bacterium]
MKITKAQMNRGQKWDTLFQEASCKANCWRQQHPQASITEIESTADKHLAKVRVAMIQELALESKLTDLKRLPREERPKHPCCGRPLATRHWR